MKLKKQFVVGLLLGALLFGSITVFADSAKTIDVIFDRVKLVVNGKMTDTPTMLYDGRTYIQLRGVSEAFGAKLDWDGNTNTATLTTEQAATPQPTPVPTPAPTPSPTVKPETPVTISQFSYTVTKMPTDGTGWAYIETQVTNYSEYALSSFRLTYLRKEYMVKYYLRMGSYVIMPGKTSPVFKCSIPDGCSLSELDLIETSIKLRHPNGDEFWVDYDHQTKTYSTIGKW